jgi:hypothetical protein
MTVIQGTDTRNNSGNERAAFFSGSTEDNITATASGNQATAYQLSNMYNFISTCATNGDSVKLPAAAHLGMEVVVINDGAANAQVFGLGIDTIDAVATATGVVLSAAKRCTYICRKVTDATAGKWVSNMGAKSA